MLLLLPPLLAHCLGIVEFHRLTICAGLTTRLPRITRSKAVPRSTWYLHCAAASNPSLSLVHDDVFVVSRADEHEFPLSVLPIPIGSGIMESWHHEGLGFDGKGCMAWSGSLSIIFGIPMDY